MDIPIPIIDIFAGPGGLGEGFSCFTSEEGIPFFKIKLSIEKEYYEHQTLELRSFFRQFGNNEKPNEYYQYLQGKTSREDLFRKYENEAINAKNEVWLAELGKTENRLVDARIKKAVDGAINWVLIGGPPCQAYSLIGRSKIRGEDKKKDKGSKTYETDHRHFLYKEYLRILAVHKPSIFVMENVKGILSTEVKNQKTFDRILLDLQNPGIAMEGNNNDNLSYKLFSVSKDHSNNSEIINPKDFIVRSEEYGIPQSRHRIIILGIRTDILKSNPELLSKKSRVSIDEVIDDLPKLRGGLSKQSDSGQAWSDVLKSMANAKWLLSIPATLKMAIIRELAGINSTLERGQPYIFSKAFPRKYSDWYVDEKLAGICNHESRGHLSEDLLRYFFASVFALEEKRSPQLNDFPKELLPNHKNASSGILFNDRFRVQIQGKPSTTVVSHISKDGHYYIHYDPGQCRSLTVREAARLQTFPDNYFFEGPRTQQYHQVGNAVPPLLAFQIAEIVARLIQQWIN